MRGGPVGGGANSLRLMVVVVGFWLLCATFFINLCTAVFALVGTIIIDTVDRAAELAFHLLCPLPQFHAYALKRDVFYEALVEGHAPQMCLGMLNTTPIAKPPVQNS